MTKAIGDRATNWGHIARGCQARAMIAGIMLNLLFVLRVEGGGRACGWRDDTKILEVVYDRLDKSLYTI